MIGFTRPKGARMPTFNLVRWLRSLFRSRGRTIQGRRRHCRPIIESLEDRLAPAVYTWTGAHASPGPVFNFSDAQNWLDPFGSNVAPPVVAGTPVELLFQNTITTKSFTGTDDLPGLLVDQITFAS